MGHHRMVKPPFDLISLLTSTGSWMRGKMLRGSPDMRKGALGYTACWSRGLSRASKKLKPAFSSLNWPFQGHFQALGGGGDAEIISQAQMVALSKQAGAAEQWLPPVLEPGVRGAGESITWFPVIRLLFRQPLPQAGNRVDFIEEI